jgi:hypothetical protein
MSSAASSTVVDVTLTPSLRGLQVAFWLHVLPACLLPFATSEKLYALPILALIALSWWRTRRHAVLGFGRGAVSRILTRTDGSWWIETAGHGGENAQLLADSIVTGWLLVLRFRCDNGKVLTRLIMGGEADDEALRRLRVRLNSRDDRKAATASRKSQD